MLSSFYIQIEVMMRSTAKTTIRPGQDDTDDNSDGDHDDDQDGDQDDDRVGDNEDDDDYHSDEYVKFYDCAMTIPQNIKTIVRTGARFSKNHIMLKWLKHYKKCASNSFKILRNV